MTTIQACVNPRLLTKASRLFTGTLEGRITELLQNARRAGAKHVEITNENGVVTVRDDGCGIDDFAKLLDLGGSGWEEDFQASEDPAGVGLFCLAPRAATIHSNGRMVQISDEGWHGAPVEVLPDPDPVPGTIVQFEDDEWSHATVSPLAVFSGLNVAVDDCPCATETFVGERAVHILELGCRIEVREAEQLTHWHRQARRSFAYSDNVLINFHGQMTSFDFHPVSEQGLWFLVDLTGEPTGIRLMLPARTQLVQNEAFAQLKAALELEAYRYPQRRGHHRLPYKQYLRAQELGIALPEATPTFQVGLLSTSEPPEPVEVTMPKNFPLARCYRFDPDLPEGTDVDETNAHLLAALGKFSEPFIPVSIRSEYNGYSWASLPRIGKVTIMAGKDLHEACVWTGTLRCVERLVITATTSDGRVFSSPPFRCSSCIFEKIRYRNCQKALSFCIPSLPWMKLWHRRKAIRSISGSARRIRMSDATSRVPGVSSPMGQSPSGWNLTSNRVAFFCRKKKSRPLVQRPYWHCSAAAMKLLSSAKSLSACSWSRILVAPFLPFLGSGRHTATRHTFPCVCSPPGLKMAISTRLRLPSIAIGKSASMSSTEMAYSWNSARAIRWRTTSFGVSFFGAPEM